MTPTTHKIVRITENRYSLAIRPRKIIIQIGPGDIFHFRERHGRHWHQLPIGLAYGYAKDLSRLAKPFPLRSGCTITANSPVVPSASAINRP